MIALVTPDVTVSDSGVTAEQRKRLEAVVMKLLTLF
jgi:hypothetical protein